MNSNNKPSFGANRFNGGGGGGNGSFNQNRSSYGGRFPSGGGGNRFDGGGNRFDGGGNRCDGNRFDNTSSFGRSQGGGSRHDNFNSGGGGGFNSGGGGGGGFNSGGGGGFNSGSGGGGGFNRSSARNDDSRGSMSFRGRAMTTSVNKPISIFAELDDNPVADNVSEAGSLHYSVTSVNEPAAYQVPNGDVSKKNDAVVTESMETTRSVRTDVTSTEPPNVREPEPEKTISVDYQNNKVDISEPSAPAKQPEPEKTIAVDHQNNKIDISKPPASVKHFCFRTFATSENVAFPVWFVFPQPGGAESVRTVGPFSDDQLQLRGHAGKLTVNPTGDFSYKVDASGFKPEELKIDVNDDEIVIKGDHRVESQHETVERSFVRRLRIPAHIQNDTIACDLDRRGHLTITGKKVAVE